MRGERLSFYVQAEGSTARILLGLLTALTVGPAVGAQGGTLSDPSQGLTVSVEHGVLVEHNPLRQSPQDMELKSGGSDTAWVSTLDGRYGGRWGRQSMSAYGRWSHTRYEERHELNQIRYLVGWVLELQTQGDLGGRLTAQRRQDPLDGQTRLDPVTGERRLQQLEQVGGALQWGLNRRWAAELQWQHERMQPNQPQTWWSGYEQDGMRFQWRWAAGGEGHHPASWVVAWRELRGMQYGVATATSTQPALDYRQGLLETEWAWRPRPGDLLSLRAARGQGRREWQPGQNLATPPTTEQDIRSLGAEWRWQPRAQWSVQAQMARDEGLQSQATLTLLERTGLALQGASDVRQARLSLQWEPTRRVQVLAGVQRVERLGRQAWTWAEGPFSLNLAETRWRDRLDRSSWSLGWQLAHDVSLRCTVMREIKRGGVVDTESSGSAAAGYQSVQWRDRGWQCSLGWQGKTTFH